MRRRHFETPEGLSAYDPLATPVWVFDVARHKLWWGNRAALEFWQAGSVAELVRRDFSGDSASVRQRLRLILEACQGDGTVQDTWTLYPGNRPRMVVVSLQPVTIEDDREALLLELVRFVDMQSEHDALRMLEAIRATTLMISSFTFGGQLLTQNPQALAAHGIGEAGSDTLAARLGNPGVAAALREAVARDETVVRELLVRTRSGPRTHRITARRGRDPVTADPVIILGEEDVTEQAQLRAQLQALNARLEAEVETRTTEALQTRQRLESVIEGARIPTWDLDLATGTAQVNAHWLNVVGLPPDAPRTRPRGWHHRVHPDDLQALNQQFLNSGPGDQILEGRCRLRHEDGRWVHLIARCHVAARDAAGRPTRLVGVNIDVTPLVEAHEKLGHAETRAQLAHSQLLEAVDALQDGFALYDASDRLVLANRRYREIYAASAPAIVEGARFEDILRHGLRQGQYAEAVGREEDWLQERLRAHLAGEPLLQELADGTVLQVVERKTQRGGRVGLRVDVTELHRARRRAEESSAAKTAFLTNMSHELRTPMNGILGMAEILSATRLDAEQSAMLQVIREAGDALLEILSDILDLARIEAGKMRLDIRPFVPADEAAKWQALHRVAARATGLEFRVVTGVGLSLARAGDAGRIGQIANNLIGNALKFTPAGSVTVELTAQGDDILCLRVADTGIGMDPETVSRVFQEFEQADNSVTRSFPGTGLGLSIVQKLTALMGGSVDVDSKPGGGTTVTVRLPVPRVLKAENPVRPNPPRAQSFQGVRALIADDNRTNLTILQTMLRTVGAEVTCAANGRQAVDAFVAGRFDVVFLDISMPVMDGIEAIGRMQAAARDGGHPLPPIIAATAHAQQEAAQLYLSTGFSAVLTKPFKAAQVSGILHDVLPPDRLAGAAPAARMPRSGKQG